MSRGPSAGAFRVPRRVSRSRADLRPRQERPPERSFMRALCRTRTGDSSFLRPRGVERASEMSTIPQKELRNNVGDVVLRAEAGEEFSYARCRVWGERDGGAAAASCGTPRIGCGHDDRAAGRDEEGAVRTGGGAGLAVRGDGSGVRGRPGRVRAPRPAVGTLARVGHLALLRAEDLLHGRPRGRIGRRRPASRCPGATPRWSGSG